MNRFCKERIPGLGSPALHLALVALLAFVAYSNTFGVPFVFDDGASILRNEAIRDLGSFLRGGGYAANPGRFVGYLTFAGNYRFGGGDVAGYHALNLAIHLANSLLVYLLVRSLFLALSRSEGTKDPAAPGVALFASLVFAVHPLQTQAVTYVVQRLTSLTATFYLAALLCYLQLRLTAGGRGKKLLWYLASLCLVLLAMKTKEIAFTLPLAVCLVEFLFCNGSLRQRMALLFPMLLTLPVIPLTVFTVSKPVGALIAEVAEATQVQTSLSRWDYLCTQFSVVVTYLRLLFLPVGQNVDYDYPVYHSLLAPRVLLCLLLLVALFGLALYLLRLSRLPSQAPHEAGRLRLVAFGIIWFFLVLSVESSLIPIVDVIFEHRVYLPSVGIFLSFAAGCAILLGRFPEMLAPRPVLAVAAALVLLLAAATYRRNSTWGDEITLWRDVVAKSPGKGRGYMNLGNALIRAGRTEEALASFQGAVRAAPGAPDALNNEAVALLALGRRQEAAQVLSRNIAANPKSPDAYYNLGRIYLVDQGRISEAIPLLQKAVALAPDHLEALVNLAAAYNTQRNYPATVRLLEPVMSRLFRRADAHLNLGVAYAACGYLPEARREVAFLADLNPPLAAQLDRFLARVPAGLSAAR